MGEQIPTLAWVRADCEPGSAVGQALDELTAYALENGCSEQELRERLEESIERTGE